MGRKLQEQTLFVYMNNELVGSLIQNTSGALTFAYAQSWLSWPYARPISLSMPLRVQQYTGHLVYNFFDNLLPDSKIIRDRIQKRFSAKTNNSFDLLYHIGVDCIGAIQLLQHEITGTPSYQLHGEALTSSKIANLLKNYKTAPLGMQDNSEFRISIAGAQEKTALLRYQNKWYLPVGDTPTTHILKLPIGLIEHANLDLSDSIENEWLCMQILQAYALPAAKVVMQTFNDVKVLVVERFDRLWVDNNKRILRIPQEDMCQALGVSGNIKYESDGGPGISAIMALLLGSDNAVQDRYNFMKAVFLYWVLGAVDGHAKNFSVILKPSGKYSLAPLYDVISAYPLVAQQHLQEKKIKMAMAVMGNTKHYKWHDIHLRHWLSTAEACKFSTQTMQAIITECFDTMGNVLDVVASQIPVNFPANIVDAVFTFMRNVKNQPR